MTMWSARCARPIYWRGRTIREGEEMELTDQQMRDLFAAGVIGAMRRLAATPGGGVEMAVIDAPEDTARTYRRRPR